MPKRLTTKTDNYTTVDIIIGMILTAPITIVYLKLFKRGRQAPRLAFLISAIGASTAIAEAVAIWGPKSRNQYQTPRILEKKQIDRLQAVRARRDSEPVEKALANLREIAAKPDANVMPALLDAARVHASAAATTT